jgi:hypothetical protein
VIQVLLGHKKLDTTALYTRVTIKALGETTSPLERLTMKTTTLLGPCEPRTRSNRQGRRT